MDTAEEIVSKVDSLENQIRVLQAQLMMQSGDDGGFMGDDLVGGGIMGDSDGYAQCFDIKTLNTETGAITLENCYYAIGGKTYYNALTPTMSGTAQANSILFLKIDASTGGITLYSGSVADTTDVSYYLIPLYKFDANLSVEVDMRTMPTAAMIEFS